MYLFRGKIGVREREEAREVKASSDIGRDEVVIAPRKVCEV